MRLEVLTTPHPYVIKGLKDKMADSDAVSYDPISKRRIFSSSVFRRMDESESEDAEGVMGTNCVCRAGIEGHVNIVGGDPRNDCGRF